MATLKLKAGDDLYIKFVITDDAGDPLPLTGGTIKFKIAKNLNVSNANAEYFDAFTSFTDPANGIHIEEIPDATSSTWTPGNYISQARFIDTSGKVTSQDPEVCEIEQNAIEDE